MAKAQQKALLKALKLELTFCELGGYQPAGPARLPARADEIHSIPRPFFDPSTQESHKGLSVFRDSPSCLNYGMPAGKHPCSECWLMAFVPAEKRGEAVPCHHIPLNPHGDTVATLGEPGHTPRIHEAVVDWLHRTIEQLERAPVKSRHHAA